MRVLSMRLAAIAAAVAMVVSVVGAAAGAAPSAGRLTATQRNLSYSGGPFVAPNRTDPLFGDGSTLTCVPEASPCDDFALTVSLPNDFLTLHPDARVRVQLASENGTSDYDIYVLDEEGQYVVIGYNAGGTESVEFAASGGTRSYTIRATPFSRGASAYTAEVSLLAADPTTDTDRDGVPDVRDACPNTPPRKPVDKKGCWGKEAVVPSAPTRERVVVSVLDSAINPYHEFFYRRPSQVTKELLAALGVPAANVVRLTRTGNFAADLAADAGFWSRVKRGERYHFIGTNLIASSLALTGPWLKPTTAKNPHGVGTSAAVLTANPDAIIYFIEANDALGSAETHAAALKHPAVDIVTTSYGVSFASGLMPAPEYRAFEHTYEGVVGRGKLHFSSSGNGPGISALRAGAGPWWSIGVSGIQEGESEGDTVLSGNLSDFVSDFTQTLPYCMDCETGTTSVSGTSFSTPRSAGIASKVLLNMRRTLDQVGGIRLFKGQPVMATNAPTSPKKQKNCGVTRYCVTVSNWQLRRALEQAAWTPDSTTYDPNEAPAGGVGVPIVPGAPWVQTAWGDLSTDPAKGVVSAALAELGFGTGDRRLKALGYCEFQTEVIAVRKTWWDTVAPTLPDNPILTGETPPPPPNPDPFVYC